MNNQYPIVVNQNEVNETNNGILMPNNSPGGLNASSYFSLLSSLSSVVIKQNTSIVECLCPCCIPNSYCVYHPSSDLKLFEFNEESHCCERCCCFQCRSFSMGVNNVPNNENSTYVKLIGKKKMTIPCIIGCGTGKPVLSMDIETPKGGRLGRAKMNFNSCFCAICENRIDLFDSNNNLRYVIKPNCYCIGCYCGCFAKCCTIEYHIYENNNIVGNLEKLSCDGLKTCCPKADYYLINFPTEATPEDKMLLIIGAILLDYISFIE